MKRLFLRGFLHSSLTLAGLTLGASAAWANGPAPAAKPGAVAAASASVSGVAPSALPATPTAAAACPSLLKHSFNRLQDEKPQALCQYSGKVLLVVNTASYCGFTGQFEGLEALNAKYAGRGLVVLGFPSSDFKQEDADAKKTAEVCFNTYGVKFPMFTDTRVKGDGAHPLFAELARATGSQPSWNFNKYLVGRDGKPIAHFGSMTGPDSRKMVSAIESALAAR
ncbi:MAG: glutathione peroxidase [Burkholderiales bacterium]|nr:glutathione peroxidase [Burkholderiales bacterium]